MSRECMNRVILLGTLSSDPEVRFTPGGTQVATADLTTTEARAGADGRTRDRQERHRLVLWRRWAEVAGEHLRRGHRVYVEGRLQTRSWKDPRGRLHFLTEVVVGHLRMVEPAGGPAELDLRFAGEGSARPALAGTEEGSRLGDAPGSPGA